MSFYFPSNEDCARHTIFPGIHIKTCAAEKLMMSIVELAPHSVVEEHAHPHEQVGMVIEGKALFIIGAEEKTLQAGDLYRIPGHTRHKVITLEQPTRAIDIFYPVREEYR